MTFSPLVGGHNPPLKGSLKGHTELPGRYSKNNGKVLCVEEGILYRQRSMLVVY